jgi:uncharacterized membrane protein
MFFIRGNYELPSWGTVLIVVAVGVALILVGAVRLGLVLIGAFTAVSLLQLFFEKSK